MKDAIAKADVLIEALPFIRQFQGKVFVIKYGGSILSDERVRKAVLQDIVFLRYSGIKPILVHGGGPNISRRLSEHKRASEFVDGIRVTDEFTLKIVDEELHKLNDLIVEEMNSYGVSAQGLKEKDKFLRAVKKQSSKDLGFVGDVTGFDADKIKELVNSSIPVVTPIGISDAGETFNINADEVAFFLAAQLKAEKLILLTNVLGVMRDPRRKDSLIHTITAGQARDLIAKKVIEQGMVPKINAAVGAVEKGVNKVHIVDAKISHAILLEIFTKKGIGTEVIK